MTNFKELEKCNNNFINAKRELFKRQEEIETLIRSNFEESINNAHELAQLSYYDCKIQSIHFDFRKEIILICLRSNDSIINNVISAYDEDKSDNTKSANISIKIEDLKNISTFTDAINRNFKKNVNYKILKESKTIEDAEEDILDYKESIKKEKEYIKNAELKLLSLLEVLPHLDDSE